MNKQISKPVAMDEAALTQLLQVRRRTPSATARQSRKVRSARGAISWRCCRPHRSDAGNRRGWERGDRCAGADAEPGPACGSPAPRFFGWVMACSHPVGVAADWLTSAWGQNTGNHVAAPAAAAVEAVAAGWLLDLLDLPRDASVGFRHRRHDRQLRRSRRGASARCCAAPAGMSRQDGLFGAPPITVLIGDDAHTTVFSALQFLGLGHGRVMRVKTDAAGRIDGGRLRAMHCAAVTGPAHRHRAGRADQHRRLRCLCRDRRRWPHAKGAWVHVDGAFGLWARAPEPRLSRRRPVAGGFWATDGHKWLQTPYDCGYAIVRDEEAHRRAMTIAASYLPPTQEGERDPSAITCRNCRAGRAASPPGPSSGIWAAKASPP